LPKLIRDRTLPACCPFCRQEITPPQEVDGLWFEFDGGCCACGAAFALDPTARNGGAVLLQTIVMASGGDWDRAMEFSPGEDYQDALVRHYNSFTHRLDPNAFGTIYFVRMKRTGKKQEG
jgi:hypothetical protein